MPTRTLISFNKDPDSQPICTVYTSRPSIRHNCTTSPHRDENMASGLLSVFARTSTVLGVGLGLSLTLHPLSPFRASPMQCQYSAPYYRVDSQTSSESGWILDRNDPAIAKQGRTGPRTASGILTASNMRQVSLGSVLGLVVGVGLRAFSRALVVLLGMGIVLVEVCGSCRHCVTGVVDGANRRRDVVGSFERVQYPPCSDDTEVCQVGGCAEGCDAAYAVQDEFRGHDGTGCVCAVLNARTNISDNRSFLDRTRVV